MMRGRPWFQLAAAGALALVVVAAYSNSLHGPLVLDDPASILQNPTIFHLWPIWKPLSPPSGTGITVEGRPILNLSFAVNYAIRGMWLPGFHLTNLLIHLGGSLLVLGICRRLLKNEWVAFAMALLWAVHPLQTESVTYIVQRAESLMGFFYLATVYGFMRAVRLGEPADAAAANGAAPRRWYGLSIACCFLGMATKEVMVSAPLVVLLLDRTLVSGSLAEAVKRRKLFYGALASSWILLGVLVAHTGNRGNTAGLGVGIGFLQYWKSQPYAIAHYLCLFVYPRRLVFDYGTPWITTFDAKMIGYYVLVGMLIVATVWGLIERSIVGFLGFWFFAILAPTSLVPGNRQMLAEHRMYLALLPVVLAFGWFLLEFKPSRRVLGLVVAFVVCGLFAWRTHRRNEIYQSDLTLFADTAVKMPNNAFAQEGYGALLSNAGRYWEAESHLRRSISLVPIYPVAEQALAVALIGMGRDQEAELHLKKAIAMAPQYGNSYANLGAIYIKEGRYDDAIDVLKRALAIDLSITDAHNNLGSAYASKKRLDLAIPEFEYAVDQMPMKTANRLNYARALSEGGREPEAFKQYEIAIRQDPGNPIARMGYASALTRAGRKQDAAREYAAALAISPNTPAAHLAYGQVLASLGKPAEAIEQLGIAVQQMPASAEAHTELAVALGRSGQTEEAVNELHLALRLKPDYEPAKQALGNLNPGK